MISKTMPGVLPFSGEVSPNHAARTRPTTTAISLSSTQIGLPSAMCGIGTEKYARRSTTTTRPSHLLPGRRSSGGGSTDGDAVWVLNTINRSYEHSNACHELLRVTF